MIQDDILVVTAPNAVFAVGLSILDIGLAPVAFVSKAEAHKADNHIVGVDVGGVVLDADAVSGGRLAGNGDVSLGNLEVRRQLDGTGHVKDNGAGAAGLDGCAEGTGSLVIEVGHMDDLSTTAAGGVHAAALGSGEGTGHAVFLRRGNGEVFILDTRRDRAGTGRRLPCRAGIQEGIGRFASGVHGLHAKAVIGSFRKPFHLYIAAFHRAALHLAAGLGKRPEIAVSTAHGRPLEGEGGLVRAVQAQGSRGSGSLGKRLSAFGGIVLGSAGKDGEDRQGKGDGTQKFIHSLSYSSAAQMSGPIPLGSFERTGSLI